MRTFMFLSIVALCSAKPLLQNEFLHFLAEHDIMLQDPPQNTSDIIQPQQTPTPPPTFDDQFFTCPLKCVCQVRVVQCSDAGLKSVPARIPKSTVMLDLQNNKITEIKETDLKNLPSLYALFLINNQIIKIHPKAFRSIKRLKLLYLSWNLLPQIPTNLPKSLVELRIDDNKIKTIQKEAFKGMKFLHVLEMSGNPLDTPGIEPDAFDGVVRLIYIRISQAKLSSVPKILFCETSRLRIWEPFKDQCAPNPKGNQRNSSALNFTLMCPTTDTANPNHLTYIRLEKNKLRRPFNIYAYIYVCFPHLRNLDFGEQDPVPIVETQGAPGLFGIPVSPPDGEPESLINY
ncbi:asporin-like isoform X4 [Carcharodon carcharias]|uniref:asporin-like isoform X4 n=1 Tax=Carcharodon carcharias TaxID=13397 RepID=UPI001B7E152A|nr:asporin-like isoform X4 [Carcharodon carcharias]